MIKAVGEEHTVKKRRMAIFFVTLFTIQFMAAADTKPVSAESAWNKGKEEVHTDGAFTYHIYPSQNEEEAWLYRIAIEKGQKGASLSIPETILGKKVTRLGCPDLGSEDSSDAYTTLFGTYAEPWHNWDGAGFKTAVSNLKSIRIPDTVEVIDQAAFCGLNSVTTITLPKKVKRIERFTFYGCDKLKTIVLPEQLESFQNSSLYGCPSLKNIQLSPNNKIFRVKKNCLIQKQNKALVFAAATGKKFAIPNGIKIIEPYAFGSTKPKTIHIPSSVSKIKGEAFHASFFKQNAYIRNITISKNHPVFARDGQCIYKKSDKSLVVAIPNKKGELRISERVEKLTPNISLVNCDTTEASLKKVIYPSRLKRVKASGLNTFDARNVYFTGRTPPKMVKTKSVGRRALPICCHVYVPQAYEDSYKVWYKKYGHYSSLDGWHTYHP